MDAWTARTQAITAAAARKHGEGWTLADLEFVSAFAGEVTDAELAVALGRTLFAIQAIKHAIANGTAKGSDRTPKHERVRLYDPSDFAWSD